MAYCKILLPDGVTELANIKSVTFREAVNSGVDLRPGCVGSASIEVEVFNTQPNAVSAGDALSYYQIDKNNTQTLIGVFYAEPVIATKNSYKFVAYDAAQKLNADFSAWLMANQSNFPMTIYALVSAACTVAGVTLGSSSWTLSTQNVQAFYADGLTCRDILSYAAELGCKFVRCHSDGNVYFDWYATASNKRIYPSSGSSGAETRYAYKQDGLQYANYTTAAIDGVAVHPSGEDDVAYIYPTSASGNLLNITNNLLLTGADASLYNAAAQAVYTALNTLGTYRPATANLFPKENPFRAGDVVAVTDAQSVSFTTVIMEQTVNESDAVLSSTGNENYSDADGNTQKALVQLASDIVRINKLKVDWADINTAIINYLTANDVTAQNLTIVDANNNVLATFNANGITLGQTDEAHAELDFNSFILKDKDGNTYFAVGDERDANGEVNVTLNYVGDGSTTAFDLIPYLSTSLANTVAVTIDGNVESNFTTALAQITFATAPADGSEIVITYTTKYALYHYDVGSRLIGSNVGTYSFVAGNNNTASQPYSSVCGGVSNKANGQYSAIGNGLSNETKNKFSYIGGGYQNKATGRGSAVGGGQSNTASGNDSLVGGGKNNEATKYAASVNGGSNNQANGELSSVTGGNGNHANGEGSAVVGGKSNTATLNSYCGAIVGGYDNRVAGDYAFATGQGVEAFRRSTFAFGEFNVWDLPDNHHDLRGNYVEIVGNGTDANNTSNARTLDWSGNEWIAGALSVGDASKTLDNLKAFDLGVTANAIASGDNLDNYKTVGTYICATNAIAHNLTSCPTTRAFKMIVMYSIYNTYLLQIIYDYQGEAMWQRFYYSSWSAWHKYSSDVASSATVNTTYGNVTQTGGCVVKKIGNVVQCEISHGNGTAFSGLTGIDSICTIPSGYRPTTVIFLPIVARDNGTWANANYVTAILRVTSAGAAEIRYNKNVMGTMKYITGTVTWQTSG